MKRIAVALFAVTWAAMFASHVAGIRLADSILKELDA